MIQSTNIAPSINASNFNVFSIPRLSVYRHMNSFLTAGLFGWALLLTWPTVVLAQTPAGIPRGAVALATNQETADYRLHLEFAAPATGIVKLSDQLSVSLPLGRIHDLMVEQPAKGTPVLRLWTDGQKMPPPTTQRTETKRVTEFAEPKLDLGADFTACVKFAANDDGGLFAKCSPEGKWTTSAKALLLRRGRLVYEVAGLSPLTGGPKVTDGANHTAVLIVRGGLARLWLDGKMLASNPNLARPDGVADILKIGSATKDFGGNSPANQVSRLRLWTRALADEEVRQLAQAEGAGVNTPDFTYTAPTSLSQPRLETPLGTEVTAAWVQPLERSDHFEIVQGWNAQTLAEGREIYQTLCVACHGTKEQPGSLPTALRFTEGQFKNGADPLAMHATLAKGYGQMVAQPQYTTAQKYAVIQYIRETFLRPHNPSQFTALTPAYLNTLPRGQTLAEQEKIDRSPPPYQRMDFGPALFWTFQVEPNNIAQKAIAIRLDDGPGGVSKGRAWMIYDHDTMRVAAATTGNFIDWKGIAFDGSHNSHTSLTGERHFVNPVGPGWASPEGKWDDDRITGRNQLHYGPLPRSWVHYEGLYLYGNKAVVALTVGQTKVLETPGWLDYGTTPVFTRTFNVAASPQTLHLRVAPTTVSVVLTGAGSLRQEAGFWVADLPGGAHTRIFISRAESAALAVLSQTVTTPLDLTPLMQGSPQRWAQEVVTQSEVGPADKSFATDTFPLPINNPWQSWLRPGGFDFTPDGKAAIVAMWNGDIWRVDGLNAPAPAPLRWRRLASGLFQPLGVKFRGNDCFVTCRDQLVRLRDLNGDGETDFIENYNNDHQVTEHFHEFAMGLQIDAAGNFYYAKSARHALPAVIPHHGTLLRISADGAKTDIIANGFRAANGVCLNPDGSFFVTDQEGHWTPKNRINRVVPGGFYGNMFGYTEQTNPADNAMQPPLAWITNAKDRSPGELLWVPPGAWGSLSGSLLSLSYGMGRAFIVPHEKVGGLWQGAVCELPMPSFATGIMRGRFGADGALYTCGMFAWAGNATSPGGFHRIRRLEQPAHLPLAIHASPGKLTLTFSDTLAPHSVQSVAFALKVWSLKRTANYGSNHVNEHPLPITEATLGADGRTVTLSIPGLLITQCYELNAKLLAADGQAVERSIHGTIQTLAE